jgi:DNA polymerase III delta subunit
MTPQAFFINSDDLFLLDTYKNNLAEQIKKERQCEVIRLSCYGNENMQEELLQHSMPDLFACHKLLILTAAEGKWSDTTVSTLEKLLENLSKKTYLSVIIALCQFKAQQLKTKSILSLQKHCEVKTVPIPEGKQLDTWIQNLAKKHSLTLSHDAIVYLKNHSKGHLYACDQLLQKCVLMEIKHISKEDLHGLMINASKYSIYDLMSAMSQGAVHTQSILDYLLSQKTSMILILWNCISLLKNAYTASFQMTFQSIPLSQAMDKLWYQQKIDTQHIVKRLPFQEISQSLQKAYRLDKIIKGSGESESVMALTHLIRGIYQRNIL